MARLKNHLLVAVGFAIAGMIGAAFGTGTAQAVVSTLVSVVNPGTNPVQTSSVNVTDPGRIAYQATVNETGLCNVLIAACTFTFGPVPSGHRVVIQHISGLITFTGTVASSEVWVSKSDGLPLSAFLTPIALTVDRTEFDQSVLLYFDSSDSAFVKVILAGGAFTSSGFQILTLTGYELDCTVAACAPIATQ